MFTFIRLFLLFLILVLAILELMSDAYPYGKIASILIALVALIEGVKYYVDHKRKKNFLSITDKKLFTEFEHDLPSNEIINFLRKNNLHGFPYETDKLNDLGEFNVKWNAPSYDFQDDFLQTKKENLLAAIKNYFDAIIQHSHPIKNSGYSKIDPFLERTDPKGYANLVNEIYLKGDVITKLYDQIVKFAREKFD